MLLMFKQAQHKAKVTNGWAGAVLQTDQPIEQHCTATYNRVSLCNYCREMQKTEGRSSVFHASNRGFVSNRKQKGNWASNFLDSK